MPTATLSGAEIDLQVRAKGTFSLANLAGTMIVSYRYGKQSRGPRGQVYYLTRGTPMLAAWRNFLINEAEGRE
jgi:hypothetical protein